MTITIEPQKEKLNNNNSDISNMYWAIYLDDQEISITSTKEQAEKTKEWMENWLNNYN